MALVGLVGDVTGKLMLAHVACARRHNRGRDIAGWRQLRSIHVDASRDRTATQVLASATLNSKRRAGPRD
jgi:hypothetical protein